MSKVIFLDYDGVVNIPMWQMTEKGMRCRYNFPSDNKVNNEQAVQWLSEFCQRYGYDIVVTSTWRYDDNYKECLINAGLREGIKILGKTCDTRAQDWDSDADYHYSRGREIKYYLHDHPEITDYLIVDDEDSFFVSQQPYFIHTRPDVGFMEEDFETAERIIGARELKCTE